LSQVFIGSVKSIRASARRDQAYGLARRSLDGLRRSLASSPEDPAAERYVRVRREEDDSPCAVWNSKRQHVGHDGPDLSRLKIDDRHDQSAHQFLRLVAIR